MRGGLWPGGCGTSIVGAGPAPAPKSGALRYFCFQPLAS